jgi:dTDP-4-amino-4,6-dideoxygalactose transaminase
MKIPFVDLKQQYLSIKEEIDCAIAEVINNCSFIGTSTNKYVKNFEEAFAAYNGSKYCIGCANGTDSLEIILKALDIGPGDEVIVPALSWISTSEAVSNIGATPVFVDIEPNFFSIDVSKIEAKITAHTKAIIPVHLYGHPADMNIINTIGEKHNLKVIEDCAQAHGSEIREIKVGNFGIAGSFSFFPGKNLGAYGDAGGIVTNNEELALKCRMISQHGQLEKKHVHFIEGRNSRLDGLQAAILDIKLKYLPQWINKRIWLAEQYSVLLKNIIKTPERKELYKHAYHLYVLESAERGRVMDSLKEVGIECAVQYPTALPFLGAYQRFGHKPEEFPVAANKTKVIFSIPIFPELTMEQQLFICQEIKTTLNGSQK